MIVRIATEGQYNLNSALFDQVNAMDNELVEQIAEYHEQEFTEKFTALLNLVREQGTKVPDDELLESHVILPSPDTSLEEAREFFTGEGLFPESL